MSIRLRILLAEDSQEDPESLICALQRSGYDPVLERVSAAVDFAAALDREPWDLIIVDYTSAQFSALAALKLLQERKQDIPFLVISGIIDESLAVEAMQNGAYDYIIKDNLQQLILAIEHGLHEATVRRKQRIAAQALADSEAWMRQSNAALISLARNPKLREGDLDAIFPAVTETAAHCLGAARVGIWLSTSDDAKFICHDLFDRTLNQHDRGMESDFSQYPVYRQALTEQLILAVSDVTTDPRTAEFLRDNHAAGITSTLDVAVWLQEKLAGVVFIEHIGPRRQWRLEEEAFASSIADLVSLALSTYQQKQTECALRKSEERYRELFENANDIIYTLDLERRFTSINRRAEELTGYTCAEAIGRTYDAILTPEARRSLGAPLLTKLRGEATTVYETEIFCKDGRRLALEINSRLIYEGGKPVGVQGIARDISERQHLKEQLRQSQKLETIGQLADVVAHDFNNLLTAILGYSQLLLRRLDPNSPLRREVQEIEKAGQRAAALTNQLLAFSRRQVFQPHLLNLNTVIIDLERLLQRVIGEDIALTTQLDPNLGLICSDPSHLEQVIMNLVVNSRDAMPKGGNLTLETVNVHLDPTMISCHPEAKAGDYILLAVRDTGVGMDKQIQSRIFEPFFTTKEPGKGTGLGLSTVYGIVKQSDGWVDVQSEPGCGAQFRIYLPRVYEAASPAQPQPPQVYEFSGSETVLLIEDDVAVRELVHRMLQLNGYTVLAASDAKQALAICQEYPGPIALMLTDVVMPQINGPELAQQVRLVRPAIKILYMSGYGDGRLAPTLGPDGRAPLVEKPFTPDVLMRRLRELLDSPT